MAKNIVICCDGTWNTPDQRVDGVPVPTNVVRLFNALAPSDAQGSAQHKYYHPGVGTDGSWWEKALGGGAGAGLDRNVQSAYRELCDHYRPGDAIFLFGFSRGAYTVRSLSGLISRCGLLDTSGLAPEVAWRRVQHLFDAGYRKGGTVDTAGWLFHAPGGSQPVKVDVPIRFLGVWDTVGALGIPDDMAFLNLLDRLKDHTFHDTALNPHVQTARHAIALDELRATFQPTRWVAAPRQDAKEMWFPGVHSDVGGSYREAGLANGALLWMIEEAEAAGLAFAAPMRAQITASHLDVIHDSCDGVFKLLATQPRAVPRLDRTNSDILHPSTLDRLDVPPIEQAPYRPQRDLPPGQVLSLPIYAREPWNDTGIWLEKGRAYTLKAEGQWLDSKITAGPAGTNDGKFQLGEIVHVAGSLWGLAEEAFKKMTGNPSADFRGTRRHESSPWFCLMGAIANGNQPGTPAQHETFEIGNGCTYIPKESGYLYAYANDAWGFYENNRGSVQLTVR